MKDYNVSVDVKPTNKIEKAEKDLIQAIKSFKELDLQEQQQLAYKFFGVAQVDLILKLLQQLNSKGY